MTKNNTSPFDPVTNGYKRVTPERARELIGLGQSPLPSDKVRLIEDDGVVFAADKDTPGAIIYTWMTFQSRPGFGEFHVLVPENAPFDHAYVKPPVAA